MEAIDHPRALAAQITLSLDGEAPLSKGPRFRPDEGHYTGGGFRLSRQFQSSKPKSLKQGPRRWVCVGRRSTDRQKSSDETDPSFSLDSNNEEVVERSSEPEAEPEIVESPTVLSSRSPSSLEPPEQFVYDSVAAQWSAIPKITPHPPALPPVHELEEISEAMLSFRFAEAVRPDIFMTFPRASHRRRHRGPHRRRRSAETDDDDLPPVTRAGRRLNVNLRDEIDQLRPHLTLRQSVWSRHSSKPFKGVDSGGNGAQGGTGGRDEKKQYAYVTSKAEEQNNGKLYLPALALTFLADEAEVRDKEKRHQADRLRAYQVDAHLHQVEMMYERALLRKRDAPPTNLHALAPAFSGVCASASLEEFNCA
mmetsp:Transcript_16966/g.27967  ORF Transcript_16966/g.27967 Transcript_16966/m.27967 type:complete len:365 (+) Transcript_16966:61-1155(+)